MFGGGLPALSLGEIRRACLSYLSCSVCFAESSVSLAVWMFVSQLRKCFWGLVEASCEIEY